MVVELPSLLDERFVNFFGWCSEERRIQRFIETEAPSALEVHCVDEKNHGICDGIFGDQVLNSPFGNFSNPFVYGVSRRAGIVEVQILNLSQVVVFGDSSKALINTGVLININFGSKVD